MKRVSVIGTIHEDHASALRAILDRIQPDVIFLEIPAAAFDDFLGTHGKLESTAVNRYSQIPKRVDLQLCAQEQLQRLQARDAREQGASSSCAVR